jgi:hypothetical protein
MNITALEKLEKGWVTLDWKTHLDRMKLSESNLSELVDKLNNWKSNRKCKEVVLLKYKNLPAYVTLKREDFSKMGKWLMGKLTKLELYEECHRLHKFQHKL